MLMEALKLLEPYFAQLTPLWLHAHHCVSSDIGLPACHDFWLGIMIAAFVFALLITALICKRVVREHGEFARNKKRLAARAIAASRKELAAAKARDHGFDDEFDALPADELADRFRQELRDQPAGRPPR
jgi:hypothetical protein